MKTSSRATAPIDLRKLAPTFDSWPSSWMGVTEDLDYGRKLLPYFEEFLSSLIDAGLARNTVKNYVNDAWLLGGSIISQVSMDEEYSAEPLQKLFESVECDGILPDDFAQMSEGEMKGFERMCRKFEKFLQAKYPERL